MGRGQPVGQFLNRPVNPASEKSASLLLALWLLVFVAALGIPPVPGSNLAWDSLNGLGLAAFALLILCCWLAPASRARYSVHALRLHITLSLLVLGAVLIHALGMVLANEVAIEYLKWRAPAYMHAGNLGFVLMIAICLLSMTRVRRSLHANFHRFRSLHRALSAVALGLAGWHVVGTGFLAGAGHGLGQSWADLSTMPSMRWWRGWMIAALLGITTLLWWRAPVRYRSSLGTASSPGGLLRATFWLTTLLCALALSYLYAVTPVAEACDAN